MDSPSVGPSDLRHSTNPGSLTSCGPNTTTPSRSAHAASAAAERREPPATALHQGGELRRIRRDRVVPPRQALIQREVLLDDAGPQGHRRDRHRSAERVIAVADGYVERLLPRRN